MQDTHKTTAYKAMTIVILFGAFFYANVVFDFSSVITSIRNNTAITYEYQKELIKDYADDKAEIEERNRVKSVSPTKRRYITELSNGILNFFTYLFSFIHTEAREFAVGDLDKNKYTANTYSSLELMSLHTYDYFSQFFDGR